MEQKNRLQKQMDFILTVDRLKQIQRQTYLSDRSRQENDAEHSWHLALMAILLQEYANEQVDLLKVVTMVLIHDIVEIEAGDTFAYDYEGQKTAHQREAKAADHLFHILPEDQGQHFLELWEEFEDCETPEARYAHTMDNCQPLLLNDASGGIGWREHGVWEEDLYRRNKKTGTGSENVWEYMQRIIERNIAAGNIKGGSDDADSTRAKKQEES